MPTLYILAGPNGAGKTTFYFTAVEEGGHDIPENIIRHRYSMSLLYLRKEIFDLDEVHLIENSAETAEEITLVKDRKLIFKKEVYPEWVNKILYLLERVEEKNKKD